MFTLIATHLPGRTPRECRVRAGALPPLPQQVRLVLRGISTAVASTAPAGQSNVRSSTKRSPQEVAAGASRAGRAGRAGAVEVEAEVPPTLTLTLTQTPTPKSNPNPNPNLNPNPDP